MDTKTYKLNHENHELNSTHPNKGITKSPDDVIKVQFGQTKSQSTPSVVQNVGTTTLSQPEEVVLPSTTILIQKIKTTHNSLVDCQKEVLHWQVREFESALKIGEDLVMIRKTDKQVNSRFKKFVEKEFSNEFSYKTADRYTKLFTRKKEIPSDVCTLRRAYISLGILKEEYQDIEKNPDDVSVTTPPVIPSTPTKSTPTTSIPKVKDFISVKKKKLYDHPNSIFIGRFRLNSPNGLFQLVVNPDGRLFGVNVEDDTRMGSAEPWFEDIVFDRLKPFVEWYNIRNQKKKEIEFYSGTVDELDRAA